MLVHQYGLTTKDAMTLLSFDDGERLEYYLDVVANSMRLAHERQDDASLPTLGKIVGNWYVSTWQLLWEYRLMVIQGTDGARLAVPG